MRTRSNGLSWLWLSLLTAACGGDDEVAPTTPDLRIDGGPAASAGIDAGTQPTGSTGADAGAATGGECKGANGCFACKPATSLQLLNACAEGCRPFDNAKRLPGFEPGKPLPPLQ